MPTIKIRAGAQYLRWIDMFGKDTTSYSVVSFNGSDITHTYFTGDHVDCLIVLQDILNKADDNVDLLNNETGRLMSWSMR